ncbi:hypothetical protein AOPFMNJM_0767 [Methylobacterium jeotgali]|uniref:Uncharacterized protein n=3 Tax=Pseudomonadota TaxID=1224 RepID=A0ABQ4SQP3_9HYPH|nr:hypothetical protein AwMethylo_09520 [Methylobacterium sp.]GJE05467.1 hypothetical protein AOPFMNJM_0767 [Methylobacterium jeotgali]
MIRGLYRMRLRLLALLCALALPSAARAEPVVAVSGVPRDLAQTRDWDRIFADLRANGVTAFFPTFQYVEQPEAKSLGFETEFVPPCKPDAPAFAAMRRHGIRLLAPGGLLYPADAMPAAGEADPLRALIACTGRDGIAGVVAYDEPPHQGVKLSASEALYRRVKAIDASLPVMMVHAPLVMDRPELQTRIGRKRYLDEVKAHGRFANMVGFDVYPIPQELAQTALPALDVAQAGPAETVRAYADWVARELPDKRRFMVLQGFSYADQYDPAVVAGMKGSPILDIVRPPTKAELRAMTDAAVAGGAEIVVFWGTSFIAKAESPAWGDILAVSKAVAPPR